MYTGELTSRLSLHECISHIYLYWLIYFHPFVDNLKKRGRSILEFIYASLFHSLILYKKGEKNFGVYACLSPCLCIDVCFVLCTSLNIFIFIVMHELRGASMKFNFNPCIYNSMSFVIIKKGEIVGPKAHRSSFDDD